MGRLRDFTPGEPRPRRAFGDAPLKSSSSRRLAASDGSLCAAQHVIRRSVRLSPLNRCAQEPYGSEIQLPFFEDGKVAITVRALADYRRFVESIVQGAAAPKTRKNAR